MLYPAQYPNPRDPFYADERSSFLPSKAVTATSLTDPSLREIGGDQLVGAYAYLDASTRPQALCLMRALEAAEGAVAAGERSRDALLQRVRGEIEKAPKAELDYVELRDPDSLEPAPETLAAPTLLALAVRFPRGAGGDGENVRLIDNRVLLPQRKP